MLTERSQMKHPVRFQKMFIKIQKMPINPQWQNTSVAVWDGGGGVPKGRQTFLLAGPTSTGPTVVRCPHSGHSKPPCPVLHPLSRTVRGTQEGLSQQRLNQLLLWGARGYPRCFQGIHKVKTVFIIMWRLHCFIYSEYSEDLEGLQDVNKATDRIQRQVWGLYCLHLARQ